MNSSDQSADIYHNFGGAVALVTGGGANLGKSFVTALASRGASVAIMVRRDRPRAQALADQLTADYGVSALALVADVADESEVAQEVAKCQDSLGPISIMIHAAVHRTHASVHAMEIGQWRRTIAVILDGGLNATKAVLPDMMAANYGRILYIGGSALSSGLPVGHGAVASAKAGLIGLARSVAQEYGRHGVTANILSPGPIETARTKEVPSDLVDQLTSEMAVGRFATIDEVVAAGMYMISGPAAILTGQIVAIDGGLRGMNP